MGGISWPASGDGDRGMISGNDSGARAGHGAGPEMK